jgi:heme/copper-type cytochrome/quinol oxidase subunit 3
MAEGSTLYAGGPLPVGSKGRLSSGWWGMLAVIATEAALFAYLLFSYFYVAAQSTGPWPPGGAPRLELAIPGTLVLLLGSATMAWGEAGIRRGRRGQLWAGLGVSILLALAFVALEGTEWTRKGFALTTDAYGSLYFTVTGFHLLHVLVGVLMLALLFVWACLGYFGARRHSTVSIAVLYWHFVTAVWVAVFLSFYVAPYLAR